MKIFQPRIPRSCPPGVRLCYQVREGDTLSLIARQFSISTATLTALNVNIIDPNKLDPGDLVCIPGPVPARLCEPLPITLPFCLILSPEIKVPLGTGGVAFLHIGFLENQAVSILANLPPSIEFGSYDTFVGELNIPGIGGFGAQIFPTPMDPTTFSTTINLPATAPITTKTEIKVRPAQTHSGSSGPVILNGIL